MPVRQIIEVTGQEKIEVKICRLMKKAGGLAKNGKGTSSLVPLSR